MLRIKEKINKYKIKMVVILFWIFIWEIFSRKIAMDIILPSPLSVIKTLFILCQSLEFWKIILYSSSRIVLGFLLALGLGIILAVLSGISLAFKELISPLIKMIKVTPVASFIILALLWVKGGNLSVLISFLMVMPVTYTNVLQGINSADEKLLSMAKVFRLSWFKKVKAIYIPAIMPHFISAISLGLGFCWKAGIAAEVIGIPANSIGLKLYEAKLYLMTKELMAWTIVIIIISIVFENLVLMILGLYSGVDKSGNE